MKHLSYVLLLVILISNTGCPDKQENFFKGNCPFERINWMKVTNTYNKIKVANLAGRIGAAASADSAVIKKIIDGNADVSFSDSLSKTINQLTTDSVEVSQEFYEEYLRQRTVVCQLWEFGKTKGFKDDKEFMKRLEDEYFEITKNFGRIEEKEKKNQQ